jgi:exopolysaccharide biosynthesis protein
VLNTQALPNGGSLIKYALMIGTRRVIYYIVKFSMRTVEFVITPPNRRGISAMTVRTFADLNDVDLAINGDGFVYIRQGRKSVLKSTGFAASGGAKYSKDQWIGGEQTLYISKDNQVSITDPSRTVGLWNAISFPNLLMQDGRAIAHPRSTNIASRTIVAVSQDGEIGYFLLVDGNELAGAGILVDEATILLASEGPMKLMINMDGGGSSTGVQKGADGKAVVFNVPSDGNVAGVERAVATHIGLRFK